MRNMKCLSLLLIAFLFLAMASQSQAVAIYTITNGDTLDKPVDPFFLPPGEDVVDFYSYGDPVGSSANTGWEQYDTALVYLTLDDQNHYGLVVVMDRPGGGGGNADLFIDGFPPGAQVVVSDDAGEAHEVAGDGTAVCDWNWITCCTDGVAYDMGTNLDFTLNLDFVFNSGIDTLRFISFDPCNQGDMVFMDLDPNDILEINSVDIGGEIPDCNGNNQPDFCDIDNGTSFDCNGNGIPDECENDCNGNGYEDSCDIAEGTSLDCNLNGIPDECEIDCNQNGVPDDCDILLGTSNDCNDNMIPDECDLADGSSLDCNTNDVPDECDISSGTSLDENQNGIPDECEEVVDANDLPAVFALAQNYPNPFNPTTMIDFSLSETGYAQLEVFDINGRLVSVLWNGMAARGQNTVNFDATQMSSGVYFYRLTSNEGVLSQRMLLLR